jgi:prevent-host-death family protein
MRLVNIHTAKTHLSRLLSEVAAGEEVVIAKAGKPVARLLPFEPRRQPRKAGLMKGKIWILTIRCLRRSWPRSAASDREIPARYSRSALVDR